MFNIYGKHKRHRSTHKRLHNKNPMVRSISTRPQETALRGSVGHWEMDTVVGTQQGKSTCLLVLTERMTRFELVYKMQAKSKACTASAMQYLFRKARGEFSCIFKSITVDNGCEFSGLDALERYGTKVYYCHPYSSWERGTNENQNKFIRRFCRKGKSMAALTDDHAEYITLWMNNYPRRILGGASANLASARAEAR